MLYKKMKMNTDIEINSSVEGEYIETKVERITTNNEPITDGAPIVFTERKEGVKPEHDIRTDRFEIALDAMDYVTKTHRAKRAEKMIEKDDKVEPTQSDNVA